MSSPDAVSASGSPAPSYRLKSTALTNVVTAFAVINGLVVLLCFHFFDKNPLVVAGAAVAIVHALLFAGYSWLRPLEALPVRAAAESDADDEQNGAAHNGSSTANGSASASRPSPTRRSLLSDRFEASKVPSNLDVIIVGSGMSGLSCAALLSRLGKKVLVLEQHDIVGGGSHNFTLTSDSKARYVFDSGLHYTIPESSLLLQLCVGTENVPVECEIMGVRPEQLPDTKKSPYANGSEQAANPHKCLSTGAQQCVCLNDLTYERIYFENDPKPFDVQLHQRHLREWKSRFSTPEDLEDFDKWLFHARRAVESIPMFVLSKLFPLWLQKLLAPVLLKTFREYGSKTTEQFLKSIVRSPRLASLLGSLWIDTGSPPHRASFMMTAAVVWGFPEKGGAFPRGGTQAMSASLIPTIERSGGRVLVRADVESILVRRSPAAAKGFEAYGVKLRSGEQFFAPTVVSTCGYPNTFGRLISAEVVKEMGIPTSFPSVKPSLGFVMANVGLKGTAAELGIGNFNSWYLGTNGKNGDMYEALHEFWADPLKNADNVPVMIVFPSIKDDKDGTFTHHTCQVLIMAEYSWFEKWAKETQGKRGDEYDKLKAAWKEVSLKRLFALYPKLAAPGVVDICDVSTPLSIEYYLREPAGGACGLDLTPERFTDWNIQQHLDASTPIQGLWLSGQDILICGQPLAQLAGIITASRMLGPIQMAKIVLQSMCFHVNSS